MNKPIRPVDAALRAPWHETHRGGCSVAVTNIAEFADEVEAWHRVIGLIQRLPYNQRRANVATAASDATA